MDRALLRTVADPFPASSGAQPYGCRRRQDGSAIMVIDDIKGRRRPCLPLNQLRLLVTLFGATPLKQPTFAQHEDPPQCQDRRGANPKAPARFGRVDAADEIFHLCETEGIMRPIPRTALSLSGPWPHDDATASGMRAGTVGTSQKQFALRRCWPRTVAQLHAGYKTQQGRHLLHALAYHLCA
ncbi:hypothetical protein K458DRAFT_212256 [Lentithecium fluviatile CBS 122367]|uniref:Uncharacterized protein n=1 Tax=Lentithecium fluviatile CBS 122367 TaxID=1168545 RepID=A0A6G1IBP8_9PLEO|nr:hypothetical protein K458DRAFT_212256 [Lentithecium fluviatile CBS 122367]